MRLNRDYMGSISFSPKEDVTAGDYGTWILTFTAGEYGIDDGGSMVIAWRSVSDWDTPQFDEPSEQGYTTISTTGNCRLSASYHKFIRPFGNSILINVHGGYIKKGDIIRVVMGDTSGGSLGMRAQSFCEREHEFRVYLDPCGTNRYEEMPDRPFVKVIPSWHHEIQAIVPGTVRPGKPFSIHFRALDEFGNPTPSYEGDIHLSVYGNHKSNIPETIHFPSGTNGTFTLKDCIIEGEGFWSLYLTDKERKYEAWSNASLSRKDGPLLFWGDMHGQTKETVGTGFLEDYYSFARDKAFVDFTGWQGNDFEVTNETWEEIRKNTKKFNEEGKFLVYLGYEWSGTTPQGGDNNVYFLDDNPVFYPSSNWSAKGCDPSLNANPVTELHKKLENRQDVLLIQHVGGRYGNLDYFNPVYTPVIEVHSHHGTFDWFALDAMKKHLKTGFIAASDDHTCRVGLSYPLSGHGKSASGAFDVASGFTGVYAENLTKKDVWKAIKSRRCYGSTFDRILLDTSVNGIPMGSEGNISEMPLLHLEAAGNHPLERIEIFDWDKKIGVIDLLPKDPEKIRIRWSGVLYRGRGKSACWDGTFYVKKGKILSAKTWAFDRIDQGIVTKSDKYIKFTSSTSGDYDGLIVDIDGNEDTEITYSGLQGTFSAKLSEIREKGVSKDMGGLNLAMEMGPATKEISVPDYGDFLHVTKDIPLPDEKGDHAYWVKVTETNGNPAWSSPVFIHKN